MSWSTWILYTVVFIFAPDACDKQTNVKDKRGMVRIGNSNENYTYHPQAARPVNE